MDNQEPYVDYMAAVEQFAAEERKHRERKVIIPPQQGEKVIDYLAVSKQWKRAGRLLIEEEGR